MEGMIPINITIYQGIYSFDPAIAFLGIYSIDNFAIHI